MIELSPPSGYETLTVAGEFIATLFIMLDLLALYVGALITTIHEYSMLTTFAIEGGRPFADNSLYM